MVAEYQSLTEREILIKSQLEDITSQLDILFNQKYHTPSAFPQHLIVLGTYLRLKVDYIRKELQDKNAHLKQLGNYMVPISGVPEHFRSLTVYLDHICIIHGIDDHLKEILHMIHYARDPHPITT